MSDELQAAVERLREDIAAHTIVRGFSMKFPWPGVEEAHEEQLADIATVCDALAQARQENAQLRQTQAELRRLAAAMLAIGE